VKIAKSLESVPPIVKKQGTEHYAKKTSKKTRAKISNKRKGESKVGSKSHKLLETGFTGTGFSQETGGQGLRPWEGVKETKQKTNNKKSKDTKEDQTDGER